MRHPLKPELEALADARIPRRSTEDPPSLADALPRTRRSGPPRRCPCRAKTRHPLESGPVAPARVEDDPNEESRIVHVTAEAGSRRCGGRRRRLPDQDLRSCGRKAPTGRAAALRPNVTGCSLAGSGPGTRRLHLPPPRVLHRARATQLQST